MISSSAGHEWEMCAASAPGQVTREPRFEQETSDLMTVFDKTATPEPQPVWHVDGVPWHQAAPPGRGHQHWAQTVGQLKLFQTTERCPCGAIRDGFGGWVLLDKPRVSGFSAPRLSWSSPWVRYVVWIGAALILAGAVGFGLGLVMPIEWAAVVGLIVGMPMGSAAVMVAQARP